LSKSYTFAIAASGVVAEKTGGAMNKYNRLAEMVQVIVDEWQNATGQEARSLAEIIGCDQEAKDKLRDVLRRVSHQRFTAQVLIDRLSHFLTESQLIRLAPSDISRESVVRFDEAALSSHQAAARLLGNQTAETNFLADTAREMSA